MRSQTARTRAANFRSPSRVKIGFWSQSSFVGSGSTEPTGAFRTPTEFTFGGMLSRPPVPFPCATGTLHHFPMALRKKGTNRGDDSLVGWAGCRVEVRPVHLTTTPPEWLDRPWTKDPDGVFVVDKTAEPSSTYDAMVEAPALLQDATAFHPGDHGALLSFVQRWGLLGAARPPHIELPGDRPRFLAADGVRATRLALQQVKALGTWLAAIHAGRWRSPALPDATHIPRGQRRHAVRFGFVTALNDALARPWASGAGVRLSPQLGLTGSDLPVVRAVMPPAAETGRPPTFYPIMAVATLQDALLVELWRRAMDPRHRLRQCRHCTALFVVSDTRRNRVFCSDACRFAFRERRRKAARRARRRSRP